MKIFSTQNIRACDAYTIKSAGISSYDLMERAATACTRWVIDNTPRDSLFVVLCGSGNNGGDGLAIARMLHLRSHGVKAFLLRHTAELSPDCEANLARLRKSGEELVTEVSPDTFITDIPSNIIIIDALLGTGINRPLEGWIAQFIRHVNTLPNTRISIDMPSGLPADSLPAPGDVVLKATHTLSFQFMKRSFLHPEAVPYLGELSILDIGLNKAFIRDTPTQYFTSGIDEIRGIYRPRSVYAHKGDCGNVLLTGGEHGKMGAMNLAARAALRSGAGLVTVLVPGCGYDIIQSSVPEAMCRTSGQYFLEHIDGWQKADAIGIGPGMGTADQTIEAFAAFVDAYSKPLVMDADALNIIARRPDLLGKIPKGSVLTPHPKEFGRIFGENTNSMVQTDNARIQAMRYGINIVLKGHHTAVINAEGECHYNMSGNAGMATGGSGDVLTGIITGLLGQGYTPYQACLLGVYLHGLAGDLAAANLSQEAMIAGDIILHLGQAFRKLKEEVL